MSSNTDDASDNGGANVNKIFMKNINDTYINHI